ncbi:MAG TPA: hypothetical protein VGB46_01145 [Flavisolibacter sp.]|jgi:hypothetical protein
MGPLLFLLGFFGGIAALYGVSGYIKKHVQKPRELKEALALQFRANQKIARDFRESLVQYAERNNAYEHPFAQDITFRNYIALLDETLSSGLSDQALHRVLRKKLSVDTLRSMAADFDEQCTNLLTAKIYFDLNLLNADVDVQGWAGQANAGNPS